MTITNQNQQSIKVFGGDFEIAPKGSPRGTTQLLISFINASQDSSTLEL